MKSQNFKFSHDNTIRVIQEKAPKRKMNWDRIIYFLILFSIVGGAAYYFLNQSLFVHAEGQVRFKKVDIQLTDDIRILSFYKHEGDLVEVGDTLFEYKIEEDGGNGDGLALSVSAPRSEGLSLVEQQLLKAKKELELHRIVLKSNERQLAQEKVNFVETKKAVLLDAYPATKLYAVESKIEDLETAILEEKSEISFYINFINKLRGEINDIKRTNANFISLSNGNRNKSHFHIAPISGTITRTFKETHEVALESEIVMSVHSQEEVYIKAFFDQSDLLQLHEGDEVHISFPDGTDCKGIIQRFYSATYVLPREFQKTYEPVHRSIAADIVPVDMNDLEKWETFYKMGVEIKKKAY
jgi:hypothetical protein